MSSQYWEKSFYEKQDEIKQLKSQLYEQGQVYLKAIRDAQEAGMVALREAELLKAQCSPDALQSELEMNEKLTSENLLLMDFKEKTLSELNRLVKDLEEGYYGYSKEGGDTDSVASNVKRILTRLQK